MEIYPKRKTDGQYVEFVRQQVARSKWRLALHLLAAIICLIPLFCSSWVCRLDELMPEFGGAARHGFIIGVQYGIGVGLFAVFAMVNIIFALPYFRGHRTEQLMLKFYDELSELSRKYAKDSPIDSGGKDEL